MTTIRFLAEWALRSSILILTGALLLKTLRIKDASIRLAAWTAMLCGSLAIPLTTVALPGLPLRVVRPAAIAAAMPVLPDESAPVTLALDPVTGRILSRPTPFDWEQFGLIPALALYAIVAFTLLMRIVIGLALCRRVLRGSREVEEHGTRESDDVTSPVTLGILNPVIVLSVEWPKWSRAKRDAVLAHERSHIARYDPVLQLLSAIHRALLWFSPLSWFLHSRIVSAAEEASDDAAVAATGDRSAYAAMLLDFVHRASPQANLAGVPMARYGRPDKRIDRILDATSLSRGVTRWSVAAILAVTAPITYLTASVRPQSVPLPNLPMRMSSPPPALIEPPRAAPQIIAQAAPLPKPQPAADARPKFDAASIRPCNPDAAPINGGGRSGPTTGRFRRECVTVMSLIENAYIRFADGRNHSRWLADLTKIEGGPGWLNTDQYTFEAEAEGSFPPPTMDGPMMQKLLEDRFQLRIHRETRESPAYALTVAGGGSKIQPAKEGPCLASDFADVGRPFMERPAELPQQCFFFWRARKGSNVIELARSTTMQEIIATLTETMDRLVVDKTGITGKVDFRLVYAPDDSTPDTLAFPTADGVPVAQDPAGPSIFTALQQQLGLKLESSRGPRDYVVIDSISRPSPN